MKDAKTSKAKSSEMAWRRNMAGGVKAKKMKSGSRKYQPAAKMAWQHQQEKAISK
jgi:hypothetical protein